MDFTTENEQLEKPVTKYLEWETKRVKQMVDLPNGKKTEVETVEGGQFNYYDKELKENLKVEIPVKFVVLNSNFMTIKGFNKEKYNGIYSNEVDIRNFPNDKFVVKCGNETLMEFPAKDLKAKSEEIKGLGGYKSKSVYALMDKGNGEYEIVNFQFFKSAYTGAKELDKVTKKPVISDRNDGWLSFEMANSSKFNKKWIEVKTTKNKTSNMGDFTIPVFELGADITEDEKLTCMEAATKVKEYLIQYSKNNRTLQGININQEAETE